MASVRTSSVSSALAFVAIFAAPAQAEIVFLDAAADTTIYSESGSLSNGAGQYVFAGSTNGSDDRRALMRFDLSSIPDGSTITSVTLSLFCSRAKSNGAETIALHRLNGAFGEAGSDAINEEGAGATALTGDATWTHRVYMTSPWTAMGGDFAATPSATAMVDRNGVRFAWSSPQMAADVQGWLDAPSTHFGWILIGNEASDRSAKRFDSRENTDTTRRPRLTIVYTPPGIAGACCATNGTCSELGAAACSGSYQGDGTSCSSVSCPQPTGACCAANGSCSSTTSAACTGAYQGNATSCSPSPCPIPMGACCDASACSMVSDPGTTCAGIYLGPSTDCSPNPCTVPTGACCAANGTCSIVDDPGSSCSGSYQGASTVCGPNPCPQPVGACCSPGGTCSLTAADACGGAWQGIASDCSSNPCPQPTGACCSALGTCTVTTSSECGAAFLGLGMSCSPNRCPLPMGSCCQDDGTCTMATAATCAGLFQGAATSCAPNLCPQPQGACCAADTTCSVTDAASCAGAYQGNNTSCGAIDCPLVLTPYVDPLPLPAIATPTSGTPGGAAEYTMAIRQIRQRLHRDLPETLLWVYDDGTGGTYPGPTIEARRGEPVSVTWVNDLRDDAGAFLTEHLLPVDGCLHGGSHGPTRVVTHLHGGHVPSEFDGQPELAIRPGESTTYEYPNAQDAGTLWYHDHALGITRLNVYAGLAGLYVIRDTDEELLNLPSGPYEVPLVIQDRSIMPNGALHYHPTWTEHHHGEQNLVNGVVMPYLEVLRGRYRFRVLNGANSRTYTISLSFGLPFTIIGTDDGLLPRPRTVTEITLGPAERVDVVVDFSALPAGTQVELTNSAPAPYPGQPGVGVLPRIMQFRVVNANGFTTPVPATLRPMTRLDEADAVATRDFELARGATDACGYRPWLINGLAWDDITEMPRLGTTEIWRFINRSGVSHPMHIHLVHFQVLDRQPFELIGGTVTPIGSPEEPEPWEEGWKDTVTVNANEIVRVIARFEDYAGAFPYHCHILEHEDHEMMRQFVTTTTCGDGARGIGLEACDDGNTANGDGCSATCTLEDGVDGGVGSDAGTNADAGSGTDAGIPVDGGTEMEGGCGCRAARHDTPSWPIVIAAASALAWHRRRRRSR
jgi:spore coat protein A